MGSITLAAPPAPCSLLTTAEVEQVLGKLAGSPKRDQGTRLTREYETS